MAKKNQKTFYFSSEKMKRFVESIIADLAQKNNRSESYIIEELILSGLLPENGEGKEIIINLYTNGVKSALSDIFSINAAACFDWKSKYSDCDFRPILEFCLKYVDKSQNCKGDEPHIHHFYLQIDAFPKKIDDYIATITDSIERDYYASRADYVKSLIADAKNNPKNINPSEFFEVITDFWGILHDWTITFRALFDLAMFAEFADNMDTRHELREIVSTLSAEW